MKHLVKRLKSKLLVLLVLLAIFIPSIASAYPTGDLHLHSNWSWDSPVLPPEDYVKRAEIKGFNFIYFTEHSDVLVDILGPRKIYMKLNKNNYAN